MIQTLLLSIHPDEKGDESDKGENESGGDESDGGQDVTSRPKETAELDFKKEGDGANFSPDRDLDMDSETSPGPLRRIRPAEHDTEDETAKEDTNGRHSNKAAG